MYIRQQMAEAGLSRQKGKAMPYFISDMEDGEQQSVSVQDSAWAEYNEAMQEAQVVMDNGLYVRGLRFQDGIEAEEEGHNEYEKEYDRLAGEAWRRLQEALHEVEYLSSWGHSLRVDPMDPRRVKYFYSGWEGPDGVWYLDNREGGDRGDGGRWPSLEACYEARLAVGEVFVLTRRAARRARAEMLDMMSGRGTPCRELDAALEVICQRRAGRG